MPNTSRPRSWYIDRADKYFEKYLKRQEWIEKQEEAALEAHSNNSGAASDALKRSDKYWQYREACALRDRDERIVQTSALMALIAEA